MKETGWIWTGVMVLLGMLATSGRGQSPVITLENNGELTWTNAVIPSAVYRVEWASRPGGPWHSFTYQPLNSIDAHSNTAFTVQVPMFYRLAMTTNELPQGMVRIDAGDVELGQVGVAAVYTNFVSGFWMDAMEVTKAKWDDVYTWAITNGYSFENVGSGKASNHPVQNVSWYDCVKWCNARSQKEGLTPCYYTSEDQISVFTNEQVVLSSNDVKWTANGYRLPTNAEWEKAARGGRQGRLFPWGGDTIQHARANYYSDASFSYDTSPTRGLHPTYNTGGFPYTSPVGSFAANGYGLYDMAGNVWEWCWDGSGVGRSLRGGGFINEAAAARCAWRIGYHPDNNFQDFGFRCVRGP